MAVYDPQLIQAQKYGASASDLSMLGTFKQRVADFQAARAELQKLGARIAQTNDMDAWREYGELVARADALEGTIGGALRAIDASFAAVRSALGLDGLRALAGLGIVWVLPVAIVAAALAALGYWISDFAKFRARYQEQQRVAAELTAQGVDPVEAQRQAAAVVAASAPKGLAETLGGAVKFAAIAAGVFFLWRTYRS